MSLGGTPEFERIQLREKRFVSPMTLTLSFQGRVLLRIDAWYLVLSSILRAEPPFSLNQTLQESMLTARITIKGDEYVFDIPQPPEFIGDGAEVPIYGQDDKTVL
jgi:hypothetical protein